MTLTEEDVLEVMKKGREVKDPDLLIIALLMVTQMDIQLGIYHKLERIEIKVSEK